MNASPRSLGAAGHTCVPLGFGTYRVARGQAAHAEALQRFLERGGDLIDTSANYGDGAAELLIGDILHAAGAARPTVVTKAGYIQGQNKMLAMQRAHPEIVEMSPRLWHCTHPQFLDEQLELSRQRLQLDRVDLFLLHNPEYFLKERAQHGTITQEDRGRFYERLHRAFEFLETCVAAGRIGAYGISSNHFGYGERDPQAVSVSRCLEIAASVSHDHHFQVIQLPLNLLEAGGALAVNNGGQTTLEFCRDRKIGVLVNRPLNAIVGGHLHRLVDSNAEPEVAKMSPADALAALEAHERTFTEAYDFPLARGGAGVAGWLRPALQHLPAAAEFHTLVEQQVEPVVNTWLLNADSGLGDAGAYREWRREFGRRLDDLLGAMSSHVHREHADYVENLRRRLERAGQPLPHAPLSQIALATLLSLEGVSCVLNGMRSPAYVEDSFAALELEIPKPLEVLRALQEPL